MGRAAVPSGASTGTREAVELRDGDKKRYGGKGVLKAVENVNTVLRKALLGARRRATRRASMQSMIELDGTDNKGRLGANALLGDLARQRARGGARRRQPLYRHLASAASASRSCRCR